jgi:putative membrane protein
MIKTYISFILKGIGMGAANVIPGVSGGTIALITGIFERLINAIKSFDLKAIKLLFGFKIKDFIAYTDFKFLISLLIGILLAVVSLAKLFDYLFLNYPVYIWAYFFGLVLASVFFVGKTIQKWKISVIVTFVLGTGIAVILSLLNHLSENESFIYLIFCGVAAICSMILPGLSGSFILVIMGNYKLIMIDAINNLDFNILLPVIIGAIGGLIVFSHLLSWVFKKYRDETISLLTGFILGSLSILWPWQNKIFLLDELGQTILKKGEPIVTKYERILPPSFNTEFWFALFFIFLGVLSIWTIELLAKKSND